MTLALLLPLLALAAAPPQIPMPEGVSLEPRRCFTTETVRLREGEGWSDWRTETSQSASQVAVWVEEGEGHILRQATGRLEHTRFRDESPAENLVLRQEQTDLWVEENGRWEKSSFRTEVTVVNQRNGTWRRSERSGERTLTWQMAFSQDGAITVDQRILLNPSALSTEGRMVGSHSRACHKGAE